MHSREDVKNLLENDTNEEREIKQGPPEDYSSMELSNASGLWICWSNALME